MMKKLMVKFGDEKTASNYAESLSILENRATVRVTGNSVIITSDDAVAVAFAKNTIKDIGEEIRYHIFANRFLKTITKSLTENKNIPFEMMDGSKQAITPDNARVIANAYDTLAAKNQTAFLVFAAESKKSYQNAVNFAKATQKD
jgi:hypothetical protein